MEKNTTASRKKTLQLTEVSNLQKWNLIFVIVCLLEAIALLLLSVTKTLPVNVSYLTNDPVSSALAGQSVAGTATQYVFDINLAYIIGAVLLVSVLVYGLTLTVYRRNYETGLQKKVNKFRWLEYSLSSALIMVTVALLSGVADLVTMILLVVLSAIMGIVGHLMEAYNNGRTEVNWLPFAAYCAAGLAQWLVIAVYVISAHVYGNDIPGFVYALYVTMFVLFAGFAVNIFLRHKRVGNWKNHLYGERVYLVLSLAIESLLAWQVYGGVLHP